MATSYSTVYDKFEKKISDYELEDLLDKDTYYFAFMESAIAEFVSSETDLTDKNDTAEEFNNDLSIRTIEVLIRYMVKFWLEPYKNSIDFMEEFLSTKEYVRHSPANNFDKVQQAWNDITIDAGHLEGRHSYTEDLIGGLR